MCSSYKCWNLPQLWIRRTFPYNYNVYLQTDTVISALHTSMSCKQSSLLEHSRAKNNLMSLFGNLPLKFLLKKHYLSAATCFKLK